MATVAHLLADANTAASPRTTASFTPTANDLLVVFVYGSATVISVGTLTESLGAVTFAKAGTSAASGGSAEALHCFIASGLVAASARTITFDSVGDQTTGQVIFVAGVAGMTKVGATAVRQVAKQDNIAGPATPTATFGVACLTSNPVLCCLGVEGVNPPAATPPTGFTEPAGGDTGYATPTTGAEYAFINSGFTGTVLAWNSSHSIFCDFAIELDASGSVVIPIAEVMMAPIAGY